jgi:hypothetical protein
MDASCVRWAGVHDTPNRPAPRDKKVGKPAITMAAQKAFSDMIFREACERRDENYNRVVSVIVSSGIAYPRRQ